MSEAQEHPAIIVRWENPLEVRNAPEERDSLLAALKVTAESAPKVMRIEAASRDDHIARQLVAATRKSAQALGVEVQITAANGDWDEISAMETVA